MTNNQNYNDKDPAVIPKRSEALARKVEENKKIKQARAMAKELSPAQKEKQEEQQRRARILKELHDLINQHEGKVLADKTFCRLFGVQEGRYPTLKNGKAPLSQANMKNIRKLFKDRMGITISYDYLQGESDVFEVEYLEAHQLTGLSQTSLLHLKNLQTYEGRADIISALNWMLSGNSFTLETIALYLFSEPKAGAVVPYNNYFYKAGNELKPGIDGPAEYKCVVEDKEITKEELDAALLLGVQLDLAKDKRQLKKDLAGRW